jgi:hypothetical protein
MLLQQLPVCHVGVIWSLCAAHGGLLREEAWRSSQGR